METFQLNLRGVPRTFNAAPKVAGMGYSPNAFANIQGVYRMLDIAIRLSCPLPTCVEVVDGEERELAFPHVAARLPGQFRATRLAAGREVFYFCYQPEEIEKLAQLGFKFGFPCWEIRLTPIISERVRRLREYALRAHDFGMADRIDLLCLDLLRELFLADTRLRGPERRNEDKIREIAAQILLRYKEGLSLERLIRGRGLSRRSFFRYWRMYFDLSPTEYILNLKIEEACQLLSSSDASVKSIAEKLDFHDLSYFCRTFKKRLGVTPLRYRRDGDRSISSQ